MVKKSAHKLKELYQIASPQDLHKEQLIRLIFLTQGMISRGNVAYYHLFSNKGLIKMLFIFGGAKIYTLLLGNKTILCNYVKNTTKNYQ